MKKIVLVLITGIFFSAFAKPDIVVESPWVRAVPPSSKNTALFMTIKNTGNREDTLLSVKTDIAKMVMIHKTVNENGIMKMIHIDNIKIPPNKKINFKPGGLHVMLMGLKKNPEIGEKIKFILVFKKSGKITVYAPVKMK